MIKLSNGHTLKYVVASGALGFDGKGWFWERPLVWLGLIRLGLFTIFLKTLTRHPNKGNLCWWKPWTWLPFSPWSCVRLIPGGAVNKVGLTNPGIEWWCKNIGPTLPYSKLKFVVSIFGTKEELVEMTKMLNRFPLAAIEINCSCPNHKNPMDEAEQFIDAARAVRRVSLRPVIIKLSATQEYIEISKGLVGDVEGVSFNSVLWRLVFPNLSSPLRLLEKKVGGGGGGVSGIPAQRINWNAVHRLKKLVPSMPVIAPSIMEYEDMSRVLEETHADALSFGTIHLPTKGKFWSTVFKNPCKPTRFVRDFEVDPAARLIQSLGSHTSI